MAIRSRLAKLIIFVLTIAILILCGRLARADMPIAGRYRFHAAMNQPRERLNGYLSVDPLGGVSGWASSPRKPTRHAPLGKTCHVLISGVSVPLRRGDYEITMTLIPTTFSCQFKHQLDETLHLTAAPLDHGHKLKLASDARPPSFSGMATRLPGRWFATLPHGSS